MSEEEIIQEIEKLELEEKEKTVKYLLKVVIEGKKDIIQEKEFFLEKKEKEIEELKEKNKKQFLNYEKRVNELEYKQLNYINKDKIREILNQYREKDIDYGPEFYKK